MTMAVSKNSSHYYVTLTHYICWRKITDNIFPFYSRALIFLASIA